MLYEKNPASRAAAEAAAAEAVGRQREIDGLNLSVYAHRPAALVIDDNDTGHTINGGPDKDTLNGNGGDDTLYGHGGDDKLNGGDGNDTLFGDEGVFGGSGKDVMTGGAGDDAYWVNTAGDKVVETLTTAKGGGFDSVASDISYSIAALPNIERLDLFGATYTESLNGTGNAAANVLFGNNGDNILDGGKGIDTFFGLDGDDTFLLDDSAEADAAHVVEGVNKGSDTVIFGAFQIQTGDQIANVENYIYTGKQGWVFSLSAETGVGHLIGGGSGNDILTGSDDDDFLDGGKGNDKLTGGGGDDTYVLDSVGDTINDTGGFYDTVYVNRSVNLASDFGGEIENAWLLGKAALTIFGNDSSNVLVGNDAANFLDGGKSGDVLYGGKGNDIYIVDNALDSVKEDAKGGIDTIFTAVDIDLGSGFPGQEIENVTVLTDVLSPINLNGNELNNVMTAAGGGATMYGGDGNDNLLGGGGDDYLVGGGGKDMVVGGDGDDVLVADEDGFGGNGGNTLIGGKGDDTYLVNSATDKILETIAGPDGGHDTLSSYISYSIAALANIEDILLYGETGTESLNATGNAAANLLWGNDGDNILDGGKGVDFFIGDVNDGIGGNDTFLLDDIAEFNAAHVGENVNEGSDTVVFGAFVVQGADAWIVNVENYTYTGSQNWDFDLSKAGLQDNTLIGSTGHDTLTGGDGDDWLDGGKGNDHLIGGSGNDTYVIDDLNDDVEELGGDTGDTVFINRSVNLTDFESGVIEHAFLTGTAALDAVGNAAGNILRGNDGDNKLEGLAGNDTLNGGKGNDTLNGGADSDLLFGEDGNDSLNGGANGDTMFGGKGNDVYFVDNAGDSVTEFVNGGIDTVFTSIAIDLVFDANYSFSEIENLTLILGSAGALLAGNALDNVVTGAEGDDTLFGDEGNDKLFGGDGNDVLEGDGGADILTGGRGDDTYFVFSADDKIVESIAGKDGGHDKVMSDIDFSIAGLANIEDLILSAASSAILGTGNALDNVLFGNDEENILDGGKGIDTFIGGDGDDTFLLDNILEYDATHVVENATLGAGSDTVVFGAFQADKLIANIENYTYTGKLAWTFDASSANGVGHILIGGSGNDTLVGADGSDRLDGGKGADVMIGGAGDDIYMIDNVKDTVSDSSGTKDTISAGISIDLASANYNNSVEDVVLTGKAAINALGNDSDNEFIGNDGKNFLSGGLGADILVGGLGDDKLTGGGGADTFVYHSVVDRGTGKEVITDFNKGEGDVLDLHDVLDGVSLDPFNDGTLNFEQDGKGNTIIRFDADGAGGDKAVTLVTLQNVTLLETDTANFNL